MALCIVNYVACHIEVIHNWGKGQLISSFVNTNTSFYHLVLLPVSWLPSTGTAWKLPQFFHIVDMYKKHNYYSNNNYCSL